MLAVVKKPRTKTMLFQVKGEIPKKMIDFLKKEYTVEIKNDDDEEYVSMTDTDWFKEVSFLTTPGDTLKIYRENFGLSQT